jgi:hypothetical protein
MVLGHGANRVSNSTPLMDSDDLKQTLWLLPIVACWQGNSLLSLFTSELVNPLMNLSLLFSLFFG